MSLTPEYGEEELLGEDVAELRPKPSPSTSEIDVGEEEVQERVLEDRELVRLDPEDNELHAPGEVCERCGQVIAAGQDVRRRVDGRFVHEVCPQDTRP